jgi:hypothetical protein
VACGAPSSPHCTSSINCDILYSTQVKVITFILQEDEFIIFHAVLRIHDILVWIWIRGSMPLTNEPDPDADPDPSIFIIDLQDANKKLF